MRADSAKHPICEHFLPSDALKLIIFNASTLVNTYKGAVYQIKD